MRYIRLFSILVLLAAVAASQTAFAETRYVSDELIITLRQGKSTQHRIIKTLKTGTPLEILEEGESYLKVRTEDGTEGYVLRQYITSEPPKSQRIAELERVNASLNNYGSPDLEPEFLALYNRTEKQLQTIEENYNEKRAETAARIAELEQNLEEALNSERLMTERYETLLAQSENVVEIAAERDQLLQKNIKLEADVTALSERTEKLADSRMVKWFLAGGGVFFFGWIIGKISRKKRSRF